MENHRFWSEIGKGSRQPAAHPQPTFLEVPIPGLVTRGDLVPQIALALESNGPNLLKNTTALRPDKFLITSTPLRDRTAIFDGYIPIMFRFL